MARDRAPRRAEREAEAQDARARGSISSQLRRGGLALAQWVPRVKPEAPAKSRAASGRPARPRLTRRPAGAHGGVLLPREPGGGAQAPRAECQCSGHRRDADRPVEAVTHRALARGPRPTRRGTYRPQPIRRATIPKPDGGTRELGGADGSGSTDPAGHPAGPHPVLDPGFSVRSLGFRPGRSAHEAVERARRAVADGFEWAADRDLDRFFDRINHDALMA